MPPELQERPSASRRGRGVFPDRDDYDSPIGTRGGYVQIDLQCSDGHHFALVIGNHKGAEIIGLARRERS